MTTALVMQVQYILLVLHCGRARELEGFSQVQMMNPHGKSPTHFPNGSSVSDDRLWPDRLNLSKFRQVSRQLPRVRPV
jgi:hypothetical protein